MICQIHNVEMKHYSNEKGDWDSHKLENGSWCNGKEKKPYSPNQALQSTALAQLQASNARIEANQKVIMQMLASIGGRVNPEPSKKDGPLPF